MEEGGVILPVILAFLYSSYRLNYSFINSPRFLSQGNNCLFSYTHVGDVRIQHPFSTAVGALYRKTPVQFGESTCSLK